MEDFQSLFSQAVKIKSSEMESRRKYFEKQNQFVKSGLYYYPKFEAVRIQDFSQRYFACEIIKQKGNEYFKKQQFQQALKEYEQALSIFRFVRNKNPNWRKEGVFDEDLEYIDNIGDNIQEKELLHSLKLALYQNLSIAYLKLKNTNNSIASCDEALKFDPNSIKTLFRKAKALTSHINATNNDYITAIGCLKQALQLDPSNILIQESISKITKNYKNNKECESQQYKNMFKKQVQKSQEKKTVLSNSNNSNEFQQEKNRNNEANQTQIIKDKSPTSIHNIKTSIPQQQKDPTPNAFQKLLSLQADKENFDYDLSYEINPNAKIPQEINDLGHFIETKGQSLVKLYLLAGRDNEAQLLQCKLEKATQAKIQKMARLDFERPTQRLQKLAELCDIDIYDESIKKEFRKIQDQNLIDIKIWLAHYDAPLFDYQLINQNIQQLEILKEKDEKQKLKNKKEQLFQLQQIIKSNNNKLQNLKTNQKKHIPQPNVIINNNYYNQSYNINNQVINNFPQTDQKVAAQKPSQSANNSNNTLNIYIMVIMIAVFIFNAGMHLLKS